MPVLDYPLIILLAEFILMAGFVPALIFLTIYDRRKKAEQRIRVSELQLFWEEVVRLNQEVIELARKNGIVLPEAPASRTYRDWSE